MFVGFPYRVVGRRPGAGFVLSLLRQLKHSFKKKKKKIDLRVRYESIAAAGYTKNDRGYHHLLPQLRDCKYAVRTIIE
jgi:hypothetical protein